MNIVFIINSLSDKSGSERVACNLANLFIEKLNYNVNIVTRNTSYKNVAYTLNSNINVENLSGNTILFYKNLQNYLDKFQPDYIVVHNMGKLTLLCSLLKKRKSKMISLEHIAFNSRPLWVQLLSKFLYSYIDKIVTLTQRDELNYQFASNKCYTIYNISPFVLSSANFNKNSLIDNHRIIAIGRLTYQKNFLALLSAWKMIQDKIDNWFLEIYGVGEDYQILKDFILNNQLKNVKLMGQINQIEEVYKQSSIFVMSSRYEGLPMVLIEAQTFGLPIISFDCPYGPAEIITHNKNGYLVVNQDIKQLADSIAKLIHSPETRVSFSKQALKDAEKFQEDAILELWKNKIFGDIK